MNLKAFWRNDRPCRAMRTSSPDEWAAIGNSNSSPHCQSHSLCSWPVPGCLLSARFTDSCKGNKYEKELKLKLVSDPVSLPQSPTTCFPSVLLHIPPSPAGMAESLSASPQAVPLQGLFPCQLASVGSLLQPLAVVGTDA